MRTFRDLTEKPGYVGDRSMVDKCIKMELLTMNQPETCDDCGGALVKGGKAWVVGNPAAHFPLLIVLHVSCARELGLDLAEGVVRR